MKHLLVLSTIVALGINTASAFALNGDFVTGFESGIFLRESDNIYEEYSCPRTRGSATSEHIDKVLQPIKLMGGMLKDKNIEKMIATVEVFASSLT